MTMARTVGTCFGLPAEVAILLFHFSLYKDELQTGAKERWFYGS
jgi:hypothetical protein